MAKLTFKMHCLSFECDDPEAAKAAVKLLGDIVEAAFAPAPSEPPEEKPKRVRRSKTTEPKEATAD